MKRNEALDFVTAELKARNIRYETQTNGANHIEIRWQTTPDKEVRRYFVPATPSDHRGRLNARAEVRRMLKQDGVKLEPEHGPRKPATLLARALDLPKPTEPIPDQIKALRAEIADLTELVLDLSTSISIVRDHALQQQKPVLHLSPPKKTSVRSKKVLDFLAANWSSLDAIARDMELPVEIVKRKCYYLRDKVEMANGRARVKPTKPHVVHK